MKSETERSGVAAPFLFWRPGRVVNHAFRVRRAAALVFLLCASALPTVAVETPPLFPEGARYDPAISTTEGTLGYALGDRMTDHAALQSYMQALSRDTTRVFQRTYGLSHEGRALRYLIISDPLNMARLEEIRRASVRLSDPRALSLEAAEEIVRANPVIVWLSYSVHGDEHSSTEAALAVAYHLAAARDEATVAMLRQAVVIIDPVQNPDGRERFINYARQVAGPNPRTDPLAADHDQPWPGGRYNHYLFDLNRDWFLQTQPETLGKVGAFLEWMPQVHVDLHEMDSNSTYYFAPPAEPVNKNIPEMVRKWWRVFGQANAAAFDREGFEYYTGERFDGYYPGYGDSWPTLHGAIGMTYEQASPRGMAIERKDGTILTLREATRHHLISSLTTVATAAANRAELLSDYLTFRREAGQPRGTDSTKAWLIPPSVPSTALRLASLLARQGVEVLRADEPFSARASGYDGAKAETRKFPAGTFIIPAAQPAGRLATALMELDPLLDERFIGEEFERRRLKETSEFYDVTSWSLPVVTGAETWWTTDQVRAATTRTGPSDLKPSGRVTTSPEGTTPYAYLLKYDGNEAAMSLVSLLNLAGPSASGLKVQAAGKPFRVGSESFAAGTVILKTHLNPGNLGEILRKEAETFGVTFHAVATGLTDEGPDLGSSSVVTLKLPRVAVAFGEPVSPTSYGATAHLFEGVLGLPFTPIRPTSLSDADLARYNVLILPDAAGSPGYKEYIGSKGLERIKSWIEGGGTLVTLRRASSYVVGKETGLTTVKRLFKPSAKPDEATVGANQTEGGQEGAGKMEPPDPVPGAILRVAIESSRYLGFGYGREGAVMVNSDLVFSPSAEGTNVVTFAAKDRLRLAGFLWDESAQLLAGAAYLVEEKRGRGRVILFADDPNFRGCWETLTRMFLNSVVFAPSFGESE